MLWNFRLKVNTKLWELKRELMKRKYPDLAGNPARISVVSCNCVGGLASHLLNMKFCSPTVNLYMEAPDFLKFCENLDHYLEYIPKYAYTETKGYPVMRLDDLLIYGVHYRSPEEFQDIWEKRKKRVNKENLFFVFTDRDGFREEFLDRIAALPAPKVLFAAKQYEGYDFVYVPSGSEGLHEVKDLTFFRHFFSWSRFCDEYPWGEVFRRLSGSDTEPQETGHN